MSRLFEEIDRQPTEMGDISLRRRFHPSLEIDLYEVILGDEHLMSSLFTTSEIALGTLGLAAVEGDGLDVLVGGLGLGYTAGAVLADERVRHVHVVDALEAVVGWHRRRLLPLSPQLADDERCTLTVGDFFGIVESGDAFADGGPEKWHAILVDIDHTPRHHLHPSHAPFYEPAGLARIIDRLVPGGVFGLWSDEPPDDDFVGAAAQVFRAVEAHVVEFANPLTGGVASNTVYVATT